MLRFRATMIAEAAVGIGVLVALVAPGYGAAPTIMLGACAVAAAGTIAWLLRMLTALSDPTLDIAPPVVDRQRLALEEEKRLLLAGLKEFEADAAIGKVDTADYNHLQQTAEARALHIIKTLKGDEAHWQQKAEKLVAERLGYAPSSSNAETVEDAAPSPRAAPEGIESEPKILFDERPVAITAGECSACRAQNPAEAAYCIGCGRPRNA